FLHRRGRYTAAPRPDLILLDLNLPRTDGREVLARINTDEQLRCIPVIILTTSSTDTDILRAYQLGANCFVSKPIGLDEFLSVIHGIENLWLNPARLPAYSPHDIL
ncbi:MAG TPA: response regulator, partial [Nakamurella sp.]